MSARDKILDRLRARSNGTPPAAAIPRPVPALAQTAGAARIEQFQAKAEAINATTQRIATFADLPAAVADYLAGQNLPPQLVATPDPAFDDVPWADRPLLEVRRGAPDKTDRVSVTCAAAGLAETGAVLLTADDRHPYLASYLPETNIVVLPAGRLEAGYENLWPVLQGADRRPRRAGIVAGPSRTGDIEQRIELGAHGPRRVHIVIVDEPAA